MTTILRTKNLQLAEKIDHTLPLRLSAVDGSPMIEVVGDPFYTIQGEGPFAGCSAVFIRLAGCNLTCEQCDTDYTTGRRFVSVKDLVTRVSGMFGPRRLKNIPPLVVITGGEPFRQRAVLYLIREFMHADSDTAIQIETNGTLFIPDNDCPLPVYSHRLTLVVSPKTPVVSPQIDDYATAFKYVLEAGHVDPTDGLPTATISGLRPARQRRTSPIYVQPADAQGDPDAYKRNIDAAVKSCLVYGYRLSLQTHKLLGLP